jgi:tRNA threonylcarbamoyladenosine biosynthesis protein TsaE
MLLEALYNEQQVDAVAQQVNQYVPRGAVITFTGPLGAGKTTLIRALLQARGVIEQVTSPTFSYVHAYNSEQAERFFHFDIYRLESVDQFIESGFDEYLATDATILIEWPEAIKPLLQSRDYIEIILEYVGQERKITVRQHKGSK